MVNDLTPAKWLVAHPWTMAWIAFAKGMVIGAVITTAVYRSRERKERTVTPSATRICRPAAWSPMVERSYRKRPELGSVRGVSYQRQQAHEQRQPQGADGQKRAPVEESRTAALGLDEPVFPRGVVEQADP
jgi:hypothetical protein